MKTKYVFVSGGVISGIGKGIIAASIAFLLQRLDFRVTPVKCENYLNIDAGTINPIEHGDPFLCDDGTEADMDIGTYEKFLDIDLNKNSFITMGQVYKAVIDRERRFEYNGEDVEAIPHITDEIQARISEAGKKNHAEIIVVELGGTAGEYQNVFYYEASRILSLKNPGDVVHVHVGYMPTPSHLGEPKTKPIQLSVRTLNTMGIQPDFIVARSEKPMDQRRKNRFALFCNLHPEDIISAPDTNLIYELPLMLKEQNFQNRLLSRLSLKKKKEDFTSWNRLIADVKKITKSNKNITVAIVGKYFATGEYQLRDSYAALFDALQHAGWQHGVTIKTLWVDAEKVEKQGIDTFVRNVDGMIVPIGWGERGAEGMIKAAGYARDKKIPYLGLCYGMQLAVVSFARDKIGWGDANTTEANPKTLHPVIHLNPMQKDNVSRRAYGGTMRLGSWNAIVKKNTIAWDAYNSYNAFINKSTGLTSERHRHRYEFNNSYSKNFEGKGLVIAARSTVENLVEIIELPRKEHPFYLGTQGHPEYKSRPLNPHPIFLKFIEACLTS
ncbi:CTP synthase [Candidatus Roizmanbacteria bacterium RIFCSPHIGHO2_01_FULL_39_8]|uniref:CTP synthase (glutamine hydrolyzing) n=2 Tax=Candidatus Roizmaniibacteriota TaxID=1752723 RepID=A0A1F7GUD1_9BACT|nr:MAG: CTP synthase [Candidatus Roizmanbacteria bacterium RIFCSPHIGHO2_01_FULL_39_8]OGK28183.1 MAG: CTP synthase [Candidatus Roizmanbacteria bacterium RIFCSPHIGHO2_02_FULL_39_9]